MCFSYRPGLWRAAAPSRTGWAEPETSGARLRCAATRSSARTARSGAQGDPASQILCEITSSQTLQYSTLMQPLATFSPPKNVFLYVQVSGLCEFLFIIIQGFSQGRGVPVWASVLRRVPVLCAL